MSRVGILGGTFDPIHLGHLVVAEEVRRRLKLDEVLFVPAGMPYLKVDHHVTSAAHRLAMLKLALAAYPCFKISTIEIDRPGPSYSVDTISQLKVEFVGSDLYFVLGWDNLEELPRWHEPERLLEWCRLVAVPRVGCPVPNLAALDKVLPGLRDNVIMLSEPLVDISASLIRERVAKGLPIDHLVPEAVARYIREKGLYLPPIM